MGLASQVKGAKRRQCRNASLTTSNEEIARNPHTPFGFRRGWAESEPSRGGICSVAVSEKPRHKMEASQKPRFLSSAFGAAPARLI
jgi:hypothetical protein